MTLFLSLILHVWLVRHQRQDVGSSLLGLGFFGCDVVRLAYIDTKKLRSWTGAQQYPPSRETAVYERPLTLLFLWLTCWRSLAHSYDFGLSNWAQTKHVWYRYLHLNLIYRNRMSSTVIERSSQRVSALSATDFHQYETLKATIESSGISFSLFRVRLVLNGAATLTTLQQRGQNHHMRARAKRMSSTRKTIATTVPSD